MDVYVYTVATGVVVTISWANEEDYKKAKTFLTAIGADCGPSAPDRKTPEFFYLQNEQQLRTLLELRESLSSK